MCSDTLKEKIIKQTYTHTIGTGPSILCIHGGPGFSHNYLLPPLAFLKDRFQLTFYDQPGCGKTPKIFSELSLRNTAQHLACMMNHLRVSEKLTLLAHSWGCIVLFSAIRQIINTSHIERIILISPAPWCRKEYEISRRNFIKRIPEKTLEDHQIMIEENSPGDEVMKPLMKYYSPNQIPLDAATMNFNLNTYLEINDQLEHFDYRYEFTNISNVNIILGDEDFIFPRQIQKLTQEKDNIEILKGVGHFPFYENEVLFQKTLNNILKT